MEKHTLNNEIVLCRASVRRAKVCIIRKKVKKIKILKSCKKKEDKDKKFKKAERLKEEILLLKKVKEDDVTKFALQNKDLDRILKHTPVNDHDHVYATLSVFPDVQKRVQNIKSNIPDWETALPILLQHLGTRSMLKKWKKINSGVPLKMKKPPKLIGDGKSNNERCTLRHEEAKPQNVDNSDKNIFEEVEIEVSKNKKPTRTGSAVHQNNPVYQNDSEDSKEEDIYEKQNNTGKGNNEEEVIAEEKVDDPFFVAKKVAIPKLLLSEVMDDPGKELRFSKEEEPRRWGREKQFSKIQNVSVSKNGNRQKFTRNADTYEPADVKVDKPIEKEVLHPSWAAKKVKLIQPFQGKKIKFDLD